MTKATAARSKVKSKTHHDFAQLQTQTYIHTMRQFSTPYSFHDIGQTRFLRSRSLQQAQKSNQGHTNILHTYIPQSMSLPIINILYLTVSEIQSGQAFSHSITSKPE